MASVERFRILLCTVSGSVSKLSRLIYLKCILKENKRQANIVFITSDISLLNTHISIVMQWVWLVKHMGGKESCIDSNESTK